MALLITRRNCLWAMLLLAMMPSSAQVVEALNPLEIKGYKFFDSQTREEVVIKGVDYYPRPNKGDLNHNSMDYYTDEFRNIWERDIPYFQELGVNAIRLYAVNGTQNHESFMCALEEAGIFVVVALAHDCPTCAVTRDNAQPSGKCYPPELKVQGQQIIKEFSKYSNTLAFSTGNEVNHFAPIGQPEWNAPCQKKFIRDMREFVNLCSHTMRRIPIGLVAADSERQENVMYYNCQEDAQDPFENAEWYGLNVYVSCNGTTSTYKEALGLLALQDSFDGYNISIPVLLTEFGCLSETYATVDGYEGQRNFLQAKWMLEEPKLRTLFSGGFAFEYSIEAANAAQESPFPFTTFGKQAYGIGYLSPENCDDQDVPCEYNPMPSFESLKNSYTRSIIADVAVLEEFEPAPGRQGRSSCPKHFPSLKSIDWEADEHPYLTCPSQRQASFTCKARNVGGCGLRVREDVSAFDGHGELVFVLSLLLMLGFVKYLRSPRRSGYQELKHRESLSSTESTVVMSNDVIESDSSLDGTY